MNQCVSNVTEPERMKCEWVSECGRMSVGVKAIE